MQRNLGFTPNKVLSSLYQLRFIAILAQLAVIAFARTTLEMSLPLPPMLALIAILALWNGLTWWRLRPAVRERWAPTAIEATVHLVVDIAILTGLLYWAGGPTNPFVSLYLVPIAIAAAAMPARHAWLITLLCVTAYSLLLWRHVPLPHAHGHGGDDFNLHVIGMWANFILSALLIASFVSLLALAVRRRDQVLAQQREEALHNEQILALGTQAAGTAHELNTPLSTMAILVDEMRRQPGGHPEQQQDLNTLAEQINLCRDRLQELVKNTGERTSARSISARTLFDDVIHRWSLLRPQTHLETHLDPDLANHRLTDDPTLTQALINLLTNAADASEYNHQQEVSMAASLEADQLKIIIDDHGPGLTESQQRKAGQVFFSTKTGGLGMGLVLSNASIERLGGRVTLENRPGGGTRATVLLPLQVNADE